MGKFRKHLTRVLLGCVLVSIILCAKSTKAYAMKQTLTGYSTIDYIAERMVKAAGVKDSMSTDKKIKKIYHYMTTHFKHMTSRKGRKAYYNTKKLKSEIAAYSKEMKALEKAGVIKFSKKYKNRLWNMIHRAGDCTDMAAIFTILCQHEGIRSGTCRGYYLNRNGTSHVHSWNWAKVGKKKYYYDVDVEIKNYRKGQGDYYWYKKTYSQAKRTHRF